MKNPTSLSMTLILAACWAAPALAVQPAGWSHTTEADFAKGKFHGAVVSSRGEIRLARKIEIILPADEAPAAVSAVAVVGKTVYAASATEAVVYRLAGPPPGAAVKFAELPGAMVCALIRSPAGGMLAATGGDKAGVYKIDKDGKVKPLWTDGEVKYVWAILPGPRGVIYAATGPGGVWEVKPNGKARKIYQTGDLAKNVLCLALAKGGKLHAGTDEKGLVIEINTRKNTGRVILDADEKEISALVPDAAGGLFVATSDAAKASADGASPPSKEKSGKADNGKPATKPAPAADAPKKGAPPATTKPAEEPGDKATTKPNVSVSVISDEKRGDLAMISAAGNNPTERMSEVTAVAEKMAKAEGPPAPAPETASDKKKPALSAAVAKAIAAARKAAPRRGPTPAATAGGKGNAVYYIGADGLVRTIFRRPVTILAMIRRGDGLILATGNAGDIYRVTVDGDEIAKLADTEAKQITVLAAGADGAIVFGSANRGSVGLLFPTPAAEGTYLSAALDAKQIAKWGTIRVRAAAGKGAKITVATRSGNVGEPDDRTWSDWSGEMPATDEFVRVASPAGRFLQYRLTLKPGGKTGPAAEKVAVIYQVGNLAPSVTGVIVKAAAQAPDKRGDGKGALAFRVVTIKAADVNGDKLEYQVQLRQVGEGKWVAIAEDLDKPVHTWDTRTVADGVYELRVVASDSPANPSATAREAARISEPVLVDNTPPAAENLAAKAAAGKVTVSGIAADAASRIVAIHYSVDSHSEWNTVLPADGIADSARERFSFQTNKLAPGPHRIAVRVRDIYRNTGYKAITVNVE